MVVVCKLKVCEREVCSVKDVCDDPKKKVDLGKVC